MKLIKVCQIWTSRDYMVLFTIHHKNVIVHPVYPIYGYICIGDQEVQQKKQCTWTLIIIILYRITIHNKTKCSEHTTNFYHDFCDHMSCFYNPIQLLSVVLSTLVAYRLYVYSCTVWYSNSVISKWCTAKCQWGKGNTYVWSGTYGQKCTSTVSDWLWGISVDSRGFQMWIHSTMLNRGFT